MNLLTTIAASGVNVFASTHTTAAYVFTANARISVSVFLNGWVAGSSTDTFQPKITRGGTEYFTETRGGPALTTSFFNTGSTAIVFETDPFFVKAGDSLRFGIRSTNAGDTSVSYSIDIIEHDNATVSGGYTTARAAKLDNLDAAISTRATPADVTVTASVAVSATTAATVATGELAITSGYTFRQTITSTVTDDLPNASKIWLAVKSSASDTDAQSVIFVEKTAGLTVVNGASYATPANGSITVSGSSGAWSIVLHLDEAATALLAGLNGEYSASVKYLTAGGDALASWDGAAQINTGVVRAYA